MRILDRYVMKVFLGSYGLCFFFFVGLFLVVDFFNQVDEFLGARDAIREQGASVAATVSLYYLYSIPFIFQQLAPFISVMAAMFTVTRLLKSNELFPAVHAGVSMYRILAPVIVLMACLTLAMFASQEYVIPELAWQRSMLGRLCEGLDPDVIEDIETITDGNGDKIRIGSFDAETLRIRDLDVTRFQESSELRAAIADYREGQWLLDRGVPRRYDDPARRTSLVKVWDTDLTPNDIRLATEDKSFLSIRQLLESWRRDPERVHLLSMIHHKFTFPLSNLVLVLLGFWTVLRKRNQSVFLGIALCLVICGGYFATDFVTTALGARGTLHPVLAAWLPITIFGSLGVTLFTAVRT